jgi:hypothetical protein
MVILSAAKDDNSGSIEPVNSSLSRDGDTRRFESA